AGVNLLAFTGFPTGGGKAQLDFVAEDLAGVRRVARKQGWRLSAAKKAFLVQGSDAVGACHPQLRQLPKRGLKRTPAGDVGARGDDPLGETARLLACCARAGSPLTPRRPTKVGPASFARRAEGE